MCCTAVQHNDGANNSATFKFTLSEPASDFVIGDVTQNCPAGARLFGGGWDCQQQFHACLFGGSLTQRLVGMLLNLTAKYEWYLHCPHQEGLAASVAVAVNRFSDLAGLQNTVSNTLAVKFT